MALIRPAQFTGSSGPDMSTPESRIENYGAYVKWRNELYPDMSFDETTAFNNNYFSGNYGQSKFDPNYIVDHTDITTPTYPRGKGDDVTGEGFGYNPQAVIDRAKEMTEARKGQVDALRTDLDASFASVEGQIGEAEGFFRQMMETGMFTDEEMNSIIGKLATANRLRTQQASAKAKAAMRKGGARRLGSQSGAIGAMVQSRISAPMNVESLAQQSEREAQFELLNKEAQEKGAKGLLGTARELANLEQYKANMTITEQRYYDKLDQELNTFMAKLDFTEALSEEEWQREYQLFQEKLDWAKEQWQQATELQRQQIAATGGNTFDLMAGIFNFGAEVAGSKLGDKIWDWLT